jgi:hypothetical protein
MTTSLIKHPRYWSYERNVCIEDGIVIHDRLDIEYYFMRRSSFREAFREANKAAQATS